MGSVGNPFIGASLAGDGRTARAFNLNPVTVNGPNLLSSVPQGHGMCFGLSVSCLTVCGGKTRFVFVCWCVNHVNLENIKNTQIKKLNCVRLHAGLLQQ